MLGRAFQFEWRIALMTAILLPLFIALGIWQTGRAQQNRELIEVSAEKRNQVPVPFEHLLQQGLLQDMVEGHRDRWRLAQVEIRGKWLDQFFLLENQIHNGKSGYFVIGVIRLSDGAHVLVNRGWILAPALRSELPAAPAPSATEIEFGELYLADFLYLSDGIFAENHWPKRIGKMNIAGLSRELGIDVIPVMVRLREKSPSALTVDWPVVNIAPEKNIAYAIQWFAMAVALLACYIALSFRRKEAVEDKVKN